LLIDGLCNRLIYLALIRLEDCNDERPCVVLSESSGENRILIAPISAQMDLFSPLLHFKIEKDHPDFKATGLNRTSYVMGNKLREIDSSDFIARLGKLDGDMAKRFQDWIG
jgi:mRNA-degrading endonuclease toxin of MazEF toxin-antitoxin module